MPRCISSHRERETLEAFSSFIIPLASDPLQSLGKVALHFSGTSLSPGFCLSFCSVQLHWLLYSSACTGKYQP